MKSEGTLASLQVGLPLDYPLTLHRRHQDMNSTWRTGFVKESVTDRRFVSELQIEGDGQADTLHHGGKDKAVLVYAGSHYPNWKNELATELARQGNSNFENGAFGENFTVTEWSEETMCIGDVLAVGTATVQVCQPRVPCWKISERWGIPDLLDRVVKTGRTGWYLRVLQQGFVQAGDSMRLIDRTHEMVTIRLVNDVIHNRIVDKAVMMDIALLPELADACRKGIEQRLGSVEAP
ncbi:MOSC domain-containing protein [Alicyclobacillus sp. SO9]|uniref:MOSC domain-containing protein n=1 Tax=Alicyclobacillus sp. SO9 TaxID=2665646 RepID=UPI0018E79B5E|nr:MOSC domain-containing protein [Alicyclobacillus sp. SO9]QQE78154.1 MOSC domain-containing protein [Alicyclobacillus sp. SO9]